MESPVRKKGTVSLLADGVFSVWHNGMQKVPL